MGRKTMFAAYALLAMLSVMPARATVLQGMLELRWGDAPPGGSEVERFSATLLTDDGERVPLDPAQARAAAENLYALANRRIALDVATDAQGAMRIDAIVPADQLQLRTPGEGEGLATTQAITGTTRWVTLMCRFSDVAAEPKSLAFFQSQYGTGTGQLDQYWREVSYGKINLTGSQAYGWFTLPRPRSYYVPAGGSANLNALFDDCTAAANPTVDFASVPGGVKGINMMFNAELDCCAWGGGKGATLDGVNKVWSTTWNPPFAYNDISPLTHEMGHGYGLPHANNSDGDGNPYDNPWDVMSDAYSNATRDPTYGLVAKHINTFHRDQLGWIDPARKVTVQAGTTLNRIALDRASLAGSGNAQMIVVRVPGDPSSRYYTVETRRRVGYYEGKLAGDAVIIHEVQTGRSTPAWSVDASVPPANTANNEGSMFKTGETWTAPGDAFRVRVLEPTANGFLVSICGGLVTPPSNGSRTPKPVDLCAQVNPPPARPPRTPSPPTAPDPRDPGCTRGRCTDVGAGTPASADAATGVERG